MKNKKDFDEIYLVADGWSYTDRSTIGGIRFKKGGILITIDRHGKYDTILIIRNGDTPSSPLLFSGICNTIKDFKTLCRLTDINIYFSEFLVKFNEPTFVTGDIISYGIGNNDVVVTRHKNEWWRKVLKFFGYSKGYLNKGEVLVKIS